MARVFNTRILLFIIAVLLIANIALVTLWFRNGKDDRRPHGEMGHSPMSVFLEKKVGFNKEQMSAFENLRKEHRQKLKPMFDDLRGAKTGFYRLLNADTLAESVITAEASKIGQKQQALDIQTFHNFRELRNLCTEQQRPVYDSLIPGIVSEMWFPSRRGMSKPMNDSSKTSRP